MSIEPVSAKQFDLLFSSAHTFTNVLRVKTLCSMINDFYFTFFGDAGICVDVCRPIEAYSF